MVKFIAGVVVTLIAVLAYGYFTGNCLNEQIPYLSKASDEEVVVVTVEEEVEVAEEAAEEMAEAAETGDEVLDTEITTEEAVAGLNDIAAGDDGADADAAEEGDEETE